MNEEFNKQQGEQDAPAPDAAAPTPAPENEGTSPQKSKERRKLSRQLKAVIISVAVVLAVLGAVLIVGLVRDRTPPELAEVEDRFEALIRSSAEINTVLFGKGLATYPRIYEQRTPHKVTYKGEEYTIYYYTFEDESVGEIVAYWYYVRIAEGPENDRRYVCYDIQTGAVVDTVKEGAYRYALKTKEQKEGDYLYRSGAYYYYELPEYKDPVFFYTAADDVDDGLYYDYCTPDCGYSSIQEIKQAAAEVYSGAYLTSIFENQFTGVMFSEADNGILYARYREYNENGYTYLQKSNLVEGYDLPDRRFDFDTMRIAKGSKSKYVIIEIESYIAGDEENRITMKLSFAKENGNWFLDSPSY